MKGKETKREARSIQVSKTLNRHRMTRRGKEGERNKTKQNNRRKIIAESAKERKRGDGNADQPH